MALDQDLFTQPRRETFHAQGKMNASVPKAGEARILELLRGVVWKADRRKLGGQSVVLGQVLDYNTGLRLSRATRDNLELAAALCGHVRARDPGFRFSTIHLNRGAKELHVDAQNRCVSFVQTWGAYEGGELWTLESPEEPLDPRRGGYFDGTMPHATLPFTGERFCVVFYGQWTRNQPMSPEDGKLYVELGFPPEPRDWPHRVPRSVLHARLQQARELLSNRRPCGITNDGRSGPQEGGPPGTHAHDLGVYQQTELARGASQGA